MQHAHDGGPDLNTFISIRGNNSRPISPAKRRSNFLIPSGTSKSISNKKVFRNLTTTQQFEALHQIAKEQVNDIETRDRLGAGLNLKFVFLSKRHKCLNCLF